MVRDNKMIYRIILTALAVAAVLVGCGGNNQESANPETEAPPVTVRTEPVRQMDFPVTMRLGGNLKGNRQTVIPARVTTTVTDIPVKVGQKVNQGDLLVMLDPGGVQSQYNQAQALFENARKQWNKMQALYEAGAISELQKDAAETEYEVSKANFNSARQGVEIESPFDGVVADIHVRTGDEVSPGLPILEVADIGSLRLLLEASASEVSRMAVGQEVEVRSPTDTAVIMKGEVISIADAADMATRSFEVECSFDSPPRGFSPGMYVTAEIGTGMIKNAMVVPSQALLIRSGKAMLYVVESDTAAMLEVNELAKKKGMSAIEGDISPGQPVVTVGHKNLTPGSVVREAGS